MQWGDTKIHDAWMKLPTKLTTAWISSTNNFESSSMRTKIHVIPVIAKSLALSKVILFAL
eukprot:3644565-Ditylum_brightwellii.AAC.1